MQHITGEPDLSGINAIRQEGLRPGVVGCFINHRRILFLFKRRYKLWGFSQGGIRNNETAQDGLWREMKEELGKDFVMHADKNPELIGYDQIDFPPMKRKRELNTDQGDILDMHGKFYLFYAIQTPATDLDITKTEFDDYQWLSYDEALELAQSIYQRGKRRVTINALNMLHEHNYI